MLYSHPHAVSHPVTHAESVKIVEEHNSTAPRGFIYYSVPIVHMGDMMDVP
jgi:hypothetical protein